MTGQNLVKRTFKRVRFLCMSAALIPLQLVLSDCASDRKRPAKTTYLYDFKTAPLLGMIYDYDNKPCSNALVTTDGKSGPRSDINGRFVTQPLSRGEHAITLEKEGYESVSLVFQFLNKSQVLYVRMISFDQLLKELERAIENGEWGDAERLTARAEKIKDDDPVQQYLKAMYLKERGSLQKAAEVLTGILKNGYHEPYVYLSLADIYQYGLSNPGEASFYIEEFLKLKRNREVEKRLEALKSERK